MSGDPAAESVWDYPRPPRLEPCARRVCIEFAGQVVVDTTGSYRVLETSHPPTYYVPPSDIRGELVASSRRSVCEWKGAARYWTLRLGGRESVDVAWSYPAPTARFAAIRDYLAFYPSRVDACFVADHRVVAQEGDFYGGWITPEIRGPFKGGAGTLGW